MPTPGGTAQDLDALTARVAGLEGRVAALEEWLAWFKSYLRAHPGGVSLESEPRK